MAINFPTGATPNQIYTYNGISWKWNGSYWEDYSIFNVGVGFNEIRITGTTQFISSTNQFINFSGIGLTISYGPTNTLIFSAGTGGSSSSNFTGGTVSGATNFTNGLTANTISAATYQNLPVSGLTGGNNISVTGSNGNLTISFTGTTGSNFTGGTVSGATNFTNGLTANTISASTYQNLPVSAVTNGVGISASTSGGIVTITNTGVTGITAGYGISANTSTGNVTIIQEFDYGKSYTTGNNLNFI